MLLAKKKLDKILIKAKAGTPYPKYFKALAVSIIFSSLNDPYPNKALTISFDPIIKPILAGTDNIKDSYKDLLCMLEIFRKFFFLKASAKTGKEIVPTAIPANAKLI